MTRLWKMIWNKKRNINIWVFIKLALNRNDEIKFNNDEENLATLEVHTHVNCGHSETMLFTEDFVGLCCSTEVLVCYCTRPSQWQWV